MEWKWCMGLGGGETTIKSSVVNPFVVRGKMQMNFLETALFVYFTNNDVIMTFSSIFGTPPTAFINQNTPKASPLECVVHLTINHIRSKNHQFVQRNGLRFRRWFFYLLCCKSINVYKKRVFSISNSRRTKAWLSKSICVGEYVKLIACYPFTSIWLRELGMPTLCINHNTVWMEIKQIKLQRGRSGGENSGWHWIRACKKNMHQILQVFEIFLNVKTSSALEVRSLARIIEDHLSRFPEK